jgi:hypothetical protein
MEFQFQLDGTEWDLEFFPEKLETGVDDALYFPSIPISSSTKNRSIWFQMGLEG